MTKTVAATLLAKQGQQESNHYVGPEQTSVSMNGGTTFGTTCATLASLVLIAINVSFSLLAYKELQKGKSKEGDASEERAHHGSMVLLSLVDCSLQPK